MRKADEKSVAEESIDGDQGGDISRGGDTMKRLTLPELEPT